MAHAECGFESRNTGSAGARFDQVSRKTVLLGRVLYSATVNARFATADSIPWGQL